MGPVMIPSLLPVVTDVEMCSEQVLLIIQGILQKDETLDTTFEFMDVSKTRTRIPGLVFTAQIRKVYHSIWLTERVSRNKIRRSD